MPFKARIEKDECKILRFLNARKNLPEEDLKNLFRLEKGFEGELMFDLLTENLPAERFLVLNDLLLQYNNSKFQIDTSIISQGMLHLFEVKNFEGDYDYHSDRFYTSTGKEIPNPLDQMKRCDLLLRQLLQNLGFTIPIKSWLVFINPEFYLYHAPQNPSIIFPTQLNRLMKNINSMPSKISGQQVKLAKKLVSLHQVESPYSKVSPYKFSELQMRVVCAICYSLMVPGSKTNELICVNCGCHEKVDTAVMRSVQELKLLFPEMKITTNLVYEWCGDAIVSKTKTWRILKKNMKAIGFGKWMYFE